MERVCGRWVGLGEKGVRRSARCVCIAGDGSQLGARAQNERDSGVLGRFTSPSWPSTGGPTS